MAYNELWKNLFAETRGRRRGSLYRAEREWIATDTPGKNPEQITKTLLRKEKKHKEIMDGFHDRGWSKGRDTRVKGYIPIEFALANPELWYDDDAVDAFFKEFPNFSTNHNVVMK